MWFPSRCLTHRAPFHQDFSPLRLTSLWDFAYRSCPITVPPLPGIAVGGLGDLKASTVPGYRPRPWQHRRCPCRGLTTFGACTPRMFSPVLLLIGITTQAFPQRACSLGRTRWLGFQGLCCSVSLSSPLSTQGFTVHLFALAEMMHPQGFQHRWLETCGNTRPQRLSQSRG